MCYFLNHKPAEVERSGYVDWVMKAEYQIVLCEPLNLFTSEGVMRGAIVEYFFLFFYNEKSFTEDF